MGILNKESLDNAFGKIKKATSDFISTVSEDNSAEDKKYSCFCTNCGTGLAANEKFCHNCGTAVAANTKAETEQPPAIPKESESETLKQDETERKQEYAGSIVKCPNCGCNISDTMAVCPDCGMQITGRVANLSVQDFKNQLMSIENTRRGGVGGVLGIYMSASKADIQKLSLIRNFPIPNSIGDVLEFMMLAIANIDVNLSKNTFANRNSGGGIETAATINRTISNAWVSKMEQAYKKAEFLFPNDPAFAGIQKMYFEKMKELKIKVN